MFYFAYGMNLDPGHMARLCPGIQPLERAVLPDHSFSINSRGFATILNQKGSSVHGMLWLLTLEYERILDEFEGVDEGLYRRAFLNVQRLSDHVFRQALVYIACDPSPGCPRPDYIEQIVSGARHFKLPEDYIQTIQAWSPTPGL